MYRDDYRDRRDDYVRDVDTSRSLYLPPRDMYYEERVRERSFEFDDLERKRYGPPPMDDPFYHHPLNDLEPRHSRPADVPLMEDMQDPNTGTIVCGSVIVIPPSPFEPKPKRREKPPVCKTVFVGSLPDNITYKNLHDLFNKCGKVTDIRVSKGRNFGHVQFDFEEDVERALLLSGCRIRVGPSNSLGDVSKLHVDYAQPRTEAELQKRMENSEPLTYSTHNAGLISAELHREDSFLLAAKNILLWIERGRCNPTTTNTFFGLISSCNTHCRKVAKKIMDMEKEKEEWQQKKQKNYERLEKECKIVEDVLSTACTQRAWDHFTKPQRKSITQWKDYATSLRKEMNEILVGSEEGEPAVKKARVETPEPDTDNQVEMEEMKSEHEAALRKKENQVVQLNSLITQFKQRFPKEWEKVIGGGGDGEKAKGVIPAPPTPRLEETKKMDEGSDSLAATAAAYAKARTIVGSSDDAKTSGISESEVAIVTVLSTFLTVNPLGATVDEITAYFKNFNPAITSIYLESLLCRLPQIFQLSQSTTEGEKKWWFLGFQTCCNQAQYALGQQVQEEDGNDVPTSSAN